MSTSTMLTVTGCFIMMLLGYSTSASNTRCFPLYEGGSLCFTKPDPPLALSWSSALQWCKNIGATLPISETRDFNSMYRNALDNLGLYMEHLWLGANSTYDPDNWYWANGTRFTGTIEDKNYPGRTHAVIVRNGTDVKLFSASPFDYNTCICLYSYSELACATQPESYWKNGKCFKKLRYNSWYAYQSDCGPSSSSFVSYDDMIEFSIWLNELKNFWTELRCSWWTWQDIVTGRSFEYFSSVPTLNGASTQCLASHRESMYHYSVYPTNQDCNTNLQFICQQLVNATLTETRPTTAQAAVTTFASVSETPIENGTASEQPSDITSSPSSYRDFNSVDYCLAIGLGVLCGGLFLAVFAWLALLTIWVVRRNRDAKYSLMDLHKQSDNYPTKTSKNAYDNYTFDVPSETEEMKASHIEP